MQIHQHISGQIIELENYAQGVVNLNWYYVRMFLLGVTGILYSIAVVALILWRDRAAMILSFTGLIVSLTIIDLVTFYFDQFRSIAVALIQFAILLLTLYYWRYHVNSTAI